MHGKSEDFKDGYQAGFEEGRDFERRELEIRRKQWEEENKLFIPGKRTFLASGSIATALIISVFAPEILSHCIYTDGSTFDFVSNLLIASICVAIFFALCFAAFTFISMLLSVPVYEMIEDSTFPSWVKSSLRIAFTLLGVTAVVSFRYSPKASLISAIACAVAGFVIPIIKQPRTVKEPNKDTDK